MMTTMSSSYPFQAIVITSPDPAAAPLNFLRECLPEEGVKLFCTGDPFGARCGSGGGTLAALDLVREDPSLDENSSVLIIHAGGESSRCPTQMVLGKAWTSLPLVQNGEITVIANPTVLLVKLLSQVFRDIPRGTIVVSASDCLLHLPGKVKFSGEDAVLGVAVPAPLSTATNHGVYCIDEKNKVTKFLQKPSIENMKETPNCVFGDSQAWIDTGVVVFMEGAARALRELSESLECCTERGLRRLYQDEQSSPPKDAMTLEEFAHARTLRVELYTHMLLALSTDTFDAYHAVCGNDLPLDILQEIFECFSQFPLQAMALREGQFRHLGTSRELVDFLYNSKEDELARQIGLVKRAKSFSPPFDGVAINVVLDTNECSIGRNSVLEHVHLSCSHVDIGTECLVSGVRGDCEALEIPNGMCFQMVPIGNNGFVYMYLGVDDGIKSGSTFWGMPYEYVLLHAGLTQTDLWDDDDINMSLWNACIHPIVESGKCQQMQVFSWITALQNQRIPLTGNDLVSLETWKRLLRLSLSEIRQRADAVREFQYRNHLESNVFPESKSRHLSHIKDILINRQHAECSFESNIASFGATGCWYEVQEQVTMLDGLVLEAFDLAHYDICGRASMLLSELFYTLAHVTDSSSNSETEESAMSHNPSRQGSIETMLYLRDSVLFHDKVATANSLRACGAAMEKRASRMTELCVSKPQSLGARISPVALDTWVVVTAPARVDFAGGWSDTPPICVEHGGAVCGIAVTVDGQKPLSCRCRLVSGGSGIVLKTEARDNKTYELTHETKVSLQKVGDLDGYCNPKSDCSLVKCALVYCGLVSVETITECAKDDLSSYLQNFCGVADVGLEIATTSLLPHGSGMGTSSILGGCVLSAITQCVGIDTRGADLIHMVLMLEQLLSTGGGWQDQVGGLIGGAKLATSKNVLPLQTNVEQIHLSPNFQDKLNDRLLLAFTGQTRLAKNILQYVLRHWARRSKNVVDTVEQLTTGAKKARDCLVNEDIDGLADCLNKYWEQKKVMAGDDSGVEPKVVGAVLKELFARDLIVAGSLCGAGGGGFMVVMLQEGRSPSEIQDVHDIDEIAGFTWHECELSQDGLATTLSALPDDFDRSWHEVSS
jgi:fucokinase